MSIIKQMKDNKEIKKYPWLKFYENVKFHIKYPNQSMYAQLKKTALKYPYLIAYEYFQNKVTYKSFLKKIDECACAFARLGVTKGKYVTICSANTPEAIACFYAINKIGAIANMMHPLSGEEEIKYGLNLCDSEYLVAIDLVMEKVDNIIKSTKVKKTIVISASESMDPITKIGYFLTKGFKVKKYISHDYIPYLVFLSKAKFHKCRVTDANKGDAPAVVLHSGGTTGKPKGILLSNSNFNSLVLSEIEMNKVLKPKVRMLAIMPIFHGFGLGCTFHACFTAGATAVMLPSVNPKKFDETILKYKPNIIACVPSILEGLTNSRKLKEADLSFILNVICGGDSLNGKLEEKINEFLYDRGSDTRVRTAFGMTECTAGVTMMPCEVQKENSIGVPCPDFYIKIVKPNTTKELDYGEIGEICVNGPSVMIKYVKEEKETSNILRLHEDNKIWLHTGDLGYMDTDGFVFFKSRLKRMIVSSGYNIYPSQIESILNEHPYVETSAVVGMPHPYKTEVAKAFIVLKKGIVLTPEVKKSIRTHCEKNISGYALPYSYGYRKELPKTLIGKLDYRDLQNSKEEE